jgi:hypothetical protein
MGKKRKAGVRKGFEAQGRYSPPERNGVGTYGTHRTADMEEAREARLRRHRIETEPCRKFNETGFVWEKVTDE